VTIDMGGPIAAIQTWGDALVAEQAATDAAILAPIAAQRDQLYESLHDKQLELDAALERIAELEALLDPPSAPRPIDDLFAVAAFPGYTNTAYADHPRLLANLQASGAKNCRILWTPDWSTEDYAFADALAAAGISLWLTIGKPRRPFTVAQWAKYEADMTGPLRGKVSRVFSWNEPNSQRNASDPPVTNWLALTVTECRALWAHTAEVNRQNYALDPDPWIRIFVGSPGLWSGNITKQNSDLALLGPQITDYVDFAGFHLYYRPVGGVIDWQMLDDEVAVLRAAFDIDTPLVNTESGLFTAPNYTGGANPVTEEQQATLMGELIDEHLSRGIGLCYFEAYDDPDPTGTKREASFGWWRIPSLDPATWSAKPSLAVVQSRTLAEPPA
jgi:hypothetical protein